MCSEVTNCFFLPVFFLADMQVIRVTVWGNSPSFSTAFNRCNIYYPRVSISGTYDLREIFKALGVTGSLTMLTCLELLGSWFFENGHLWVLTWSRKTLGPGSEDLVPGSCEQGQKQLSTLSLTCCVLLHLLGERRGINAAALLFQEILLKKQWHPLDG